jgi:hypothetical protein
VKKRKKHKTALLRPTEKKRKTGLKVNICKHDIYSFFGFTVQKDMLFGWDEFNRPFASNGRFCFDDESIPVYFLLRQDETGDYIWSSPIRIKRVDREKLIDAISARALRQADGVQYLDDLGLEYARHDRRAHNKQSILDGARCRSTHLHYDAVRRSGAFWDKSKLTSTGMVSYNTSFTDDTKLSGEGVTVSEKLSRADMIKHEYDRGLITEEYRDYLLRRAGETIDAA